MPPQILHLVISLAPGGLERLVVDWANARNRRYPGSTRICCLDELGELAGQVEGSGQRAEGSGQRAVGSGQRAEGSGQWAVGGGQWAKGREQWAKASGRKRGSQNRKSKIQK